VRGYNYRVLYYSRTPLEIDEGYKKVAFLASGSHALLEIPVPSLSLKVSVGCFHCRHANVLPEVAHKKQITKSRKKNISVNFRSYKSGFCQDEVD
jgi:hypothetical protein